MSFARAAAQSALALGAVCGALAHAAITAESAYPSKVIRIVVPFTPGGPTDINARMVAQRLIEAWGQAVVVDNRPAAGGVPGTDLVAKAAPDGYTLLGANSGPLTIAPGLHSNLPYDPLRDLAAVILTTHTMAVFAVQPGLPVRTIQELIALAKAKPGALTFGSTGIGTVSHLTFELFCNMASIRMTHVPYKGTAQATNDFLAGQIDLRTLSIPIALPLLKTGRARVLSVNGRQRSPLLPEVPTVAESGLPGFESNSWNGIMAPAGTPRAIIMRLHDEIARRVLRGEQREQLIKEGYEIAGLDPETFSAYLRAETVKWAKVIKAANVKAE